MKGVKEAIADPMDPVCPEDDRPSVKDLIKEHADKIAKIKEALLDHPLYEESKHDDLWILRFWLSHKKSKAAIDAAKHTLAFRKEYKLDEQDIRKVAPHQVKEGMVRDYLDCWKDDAMIFTHPHPQRGVIVFLKLSSMDQHKVVEMLTEDHWLPVFMYSSEFSHQWLDYVTRTTGRFTKSVRFIDLDGFALSSVNRTCSKRDGHVMGLMEDCYPQLLETIFACNPNLVIDVIWKMLRSLIPKRVVAKFDIMHPKENLNDRQKLFRHISETDLPCFYGGKNPISPHDWEVKTEEEITEEVDC
jgi:hypothetical protein